jgi:hypothetical protein
MNKNALGDGNIFLTQLMLLSITRNGITRRKFKTPMAFFTVQDSGAGQSKQLY